MYSEALLDHFRNPRNAGELEPPAAAIEVSNPVCGDILRLSARIEDGRVAEVRYKTRGCTASIAAGSALTELIQGKSLEAIARLAPRDVEAALGGLSNESKHAAVLAIDAARALVSASGSSPASSARATRSR
jgi:nitrogen fixation NifU-like protein